MAIASFVNRIKEMFSGGSSSSAPPPTTPGQAAGTGKPDGQSSASLKESASNLTGQAQAKASGMTDQAKQAASGMQSKMDDMINRGQETAAEAAGSMPGRDQMPDGMSDAAGSARSAASGAGDDLTQRVDELKTSAEAQVDDASNEFEERRS